MPKMLATTAKLVGLEPGSTGWFKAPGYCSAVTDYICWFWSELVSPPTMETYQPIADLDLNDSVNGIEEEPFYIDDYEYGDFAFSGNTSIFELKLYPEEIATRYLFTYVCPALLILGTVGNIAAMVFMLRRAKVLLSTCHYLAVLAVLDTLLLWVRCADDAMRFIFDINPVNSFLLYSDAVCKVLMLTFSLVTHLRAWLLVCVAIETVIVVCHPRKARSICVTSRSRAVTWIIIVVLLLINGHFFWSHRLEVVLDQMSQHTIRRCTHEDTGQDMEDNFIRIWPIFNQCITDFFPLGIILICAIACLLKLCTSCRSSDVQPFGAKYMLDPISYRQMSNILVCLLVYALLMLTPKVGYEQYYRSSGLQMASDSFEKQQQAELGRCVSNVLVYLFCSTKVFFYLIGCTAVRQDVRLCCLGCKSFGYRLRERKPSKTLPAATENCSEDGAQVEMATLCSSAPASTSPQYDLRLYPRDSLDGALVPMSLSPEDESSTGLKRRSYAHEMLDGYAFRSESTPLRMPVSPRSGFDSPEDGERSDSQELEVIINVRPPDMDGPRRIASI